MRSSSWSANCPDRPTSYPTLAKASSFPSASLYLNIEKSDNSVYEPDTTDYDLSIEKGKTDGIYIWMQRFSLFMIKKETSVMVNWEGSSDGNLAAA